MSVRERLSAAGTLFRQFRPLTALAMLVHDLVRKLTDRHAILSYAQTGEDRVIDYYVGYPGSGFYVDVGCHLPARNSATMRLYRRGWRGLCIDANPECIRRFRKLRPRDTCVTAAVSDAVGERVFTEFKDADLSSLSDDFVATRDPSRIVARRRVTTVTLTALCRRHAVPERFELLVVDCEGHDLEVLRSLDLDAFRPRIVAVEMHAFDLSRARENPVYAHLEARDYRLAAYATMNGYFVDRRTSGDSAAPGRSAR